MSVREGMFDEVAQSFLEAAAQTQLWPLALSTFAKASGSRGADICPSALGLGIFSNNAFDEMAADVIAARDTVYNSRMAGGVRLARSGWTRLITDCHVYGDPRQRDRDPFQELMGRHSYRHYAGQIFAQSNGVVWALCAERTPDEGIFGVRELAALDRLFERLKIAGKLAITLGAARTNGLIDALAVMDVPALVLDRMGRLIRGNARGEAILGHPLALAGGRPVAAGACNSALQVQIDVSVSPFVADNLDRLETVVIPQRELDRRPLLVDLVPVVGTARDAFTPGRAVMLITDLNEIAQTPESLIRRLFALTAVEARVLLSLTAGRDIAKTAEYLGIAIGTARVHLRNIFAKTDTHRQTELVGLIGRVVSRSKISGGL